MEQLVARKAHNLEVPGSSPGPATLVKKHPSKGVFLYWGGPVQTRTGDLFDVNEAL